MDRSGIWLIGGASGTGKSRVAYPLAEGLGVPLVELDDIVEAVLRLTTPEQQPILHYWRTHPEAAELPVERIVELQVETARTLAPAVEAIIANHLETATPVVIEGDYLLPSTLARPAFAGRPSDGRVRGVMLLEGDERRLLDDYLDREPDEGMQRRRAAVSRGFGEWLAADAAAAGIPVIPARPWSTALTRVPAALEASPRPPA